MSATVRDVLLFALELLPEVRRTDRVLPVALGFAVGTGAMLFILWRTRAREESEAGHSSPTGVVTGVGVDILIDGLVLGSGSPPTPTPGCC